jgi:hypothetical protein
MTTKAEFTEQEWDLIREAPPTAGLIVVTAQRGGTFRETLAIAKAYADARGQHGESEFLDELVSSKPKTDRTRHHSFEELKEYGLRQVADAVGLLESKATPEEVEDYRRFVLAVAERVANAHREEGTAVSPGERAAIDEIAGALGAR